MISTHAGLRPSQQSLLGLAAINCDHCKPGQILNTLGAIAAGQITGAEDIAAAINKFCRCGAYAQTQ